MTGLLVTGSAVLSTAACLFLLLCWRKQSRLICERDSDATILAEKIIELGKAVDSMTVRLEEIERRKTITIDGSAEPASVNLNRRGQVLRLSRRGDSAGQIASALGLSQGEVKLTLRVHEMILDHSDEKIRREPSSFSQRMSI